MNVVLVLNQKLKNDVRFMVNVSKDEIKNRVTRLIEEDRSKEAFDLLLKEAQVIDYLPQGRKSMFKADFVLMEDLL